MRPFPIFVAACIFSTSVMSAEEHVGRDAERGDPARWSEPADTPQKRYATAMKEAAAAKAEAMKECRASAQRAQCDAEARRQYDADLQRARGLLMGAQSK